MKTFKDLKPGDKVIVINPDSLEIQFLPILDIYGDGTKDVLIIQVTDYEKFYARVYSYETHCCFNSVAEPELRRELGEIWINPKEAYKSLSCNLDGKIKIVNKGLRSLELLGTAILAGD